MHSKAPKQKAKSLWQVSELAAGLTPTVIAMDGIAVVVNHNNTVDNLTSEQVKEIFTGKLTDWSAAQ